MKSVILHYLFLWKPLGYLLAFLGMLIGGDETIFIASFLTRARFFEFTFIFLTLLAGAFFSDFFWYTLGTRLNPNKFFGRSVLKFVGRIDEHLEAKPFRTIFISKFTYGFNHIMIIRAGMLGLDKSEFFFADSAAIFSWVAIIGWLGYVSGSSLLPLRHLLKYTEIALLLGLGGFIVFEALIQYWLKKRI